MLAGLCKTRHMYMSGARGPPSRRSVDVPTLGVRLDDEFRIKQGEAWSQAAWEVLPLPADTEAALREYVAAHECVTLAQARLEDARVAFVTGPAVEPLRRLLQPEPWHLPLQSLVAPEDVVAVRAALTALGAVVKVCTPSVEGYSGVRLHLEFEEPGVLDEPLMGLTVAGFATWETWESRTLNDVVEPPVVAKRSSICQRLAALCCHTHSHPVRRSRLVLSGTLYKKGERYPPHVAQDSDDMSAAEAWQSVVDMSAEERRAFATKFVQGADLVRAIEWGESRTVDPDAALFAAFRALQQERYGAGQVEARGGVAIAALRQARSAPPSEN